MTEFKFYIPKRLPGKNEIVAANKRLVPWLSKGKRRVYQYTVMKRELEAYIGSWIIKQHQSQRFEECQIEFTWFERNRRRDPRNVMAGAEFILDALVKCRVLKNDNWLVKDFTDRFVVDKEQEGVQVTINENKNGDENETALRFDKIRGCGKG